MGWVYAPRLHHHGMLISFTTGHVKGLCGLSARVVQERADVFITLLVVGDLRKKVELEINRYFPEGKVDFGPTGKIR